MRWPVLITALGAAFTGGSAATGDPLAAPTPSFMPMAEISTPIIDASRLDGQLKVLATLQTDNPQMLPVLREDSPQLRADLYAAALEFARIYASGLRAVDAQRLGDDLTAAAKRSHPEVSRVLIIRLSAEPA